MANQQLSRNWPETDGRNPSTSTALCIASNADAL